LIALTDVGLAYLCVAATSVDPRRRKAWLKAVAERLERTGERSIGPLGPSPAAHRQRRAAGRERTRRWRDRLRRKAALYTIEVTDAELNMAERFAGLDPDETDPRKIAIAIGRLLRVALAMLRERDCR
jgi:hypothetical protein